MKNQTKTEQSEQTTIRGKKRWQSPELVVINQYDIDQCSSTWPGSAEGTQQVKAPALQVRVKKAIRAKHK